MIDFETWQDELEVARLRLIEELIKRDPAPDTLEGRVLLELVAWQEAFEAAELGDDLP